MPQQELDKLLSFMKAAEKFPIMPFSKNDSNFINEQKETLSFKLLMNHIRKGNTAEAITILDSNPDMVNKPENTLDMISVGRFTTPFLVSCTYNNNHILNHILTDNKFKVDYLTQSHCGQQALAHAVVRSEQPPEVQKAQQKTVKLLTDNAHKNLSSDNYKQFLLGGGVWQRTALYNSFEVSKNSKAADIILGAIKDAGYITDATEQLLQLKRPIYFYAHTPKQLDILLSGLNNNQKTQALLCRDDVGSTVLHWAKTPEIAEYITKQVPELASVKDYDNRTPAETTFLAGYKGASSVIFKYVHSNKESIQNNIHALTHKKDAQNALKEAIQSISQDKPVKPEIKEILLANQVNLTQGTKEFLKLYKVLDTGLQSACLPLENFNYGHQFGIENEFHMPKDIEPIIKPLLNIFNRVLPETPDKILTFGQDPEPSVLPNGPDSVSVEINSPIIRTKSVEQSFYQLCDIAKDLGAEKNSTSGIHVHVGCQNYLTKENQGLTGKTNSSDAEIQLAFLKTFLHITQKARPIFDSFCRSQERQDYPKAWDSPVIKGLDLTTNMTPEQDYFHKVNSLTDFSQIPDFTLQIKRGKYVLVALPKDSKGTLEIRELKNNATNETGMNNNEIKNIFNFVHKIANLTTEILQKNPPQANEIYKSTIDSKHKDINALAQCFSVELVKILNKSLSAPAMSLERKQKISNLKIL